MTTQSLVGEILHQSRVEPRPYQTRIVGKTLDMFGGAYRNAAGDAEPAARSVMIESPTGSGKTCMGLLIARALQQHEGVRVGWVAMRRNLLEQVRCENERHQIGVDLQTISMFDKAPPTDIDLLVIDECVPGDTLVDVLVDGQRRQARIDEVVLKAVGSSVLSYSDAGELEYQPIVSRVPMGRKELVEVTVRTDDGEKILLITEEGKVWTEAGYKKPLDLLRNTVLCKSSRCSTYLYGQRTTERSGEVRSNPAGKGGGRARLRLRLWAEGAVVPSPEDVQEVPVQPLPAESGCDAHAQAAADYAWDATGRRVRQFCPQPADQRTDQRPLENPAFDEAAAGVCELAARSPAALERKASDSGESGLRSRSGRVQHVVPSLYPGSGSATLHAQEIPDTGVSGPPGRPGVRRVVDGQRLNRGDCDARVHGTGEPGDRGLVAGPLGHFRQHLRGQTGAQAIPQLASAEHGSVAAAGCPARDQVAVVQVWEIPADALVRGTVVAVRRTGRFVETYDIGVAKNHNFFADGILIHNCQHDAASSCAHLHNVIRPKWILGLTATPYRTDCVKLCFDKVIKDAGIHQLIQDGYLSQFEHYTVPKWNVSQLADFYCAEPDRWGKSIFFFHSLEDCFALDAVLRNRGVVSDVVTGNSDRDRQLDAFRNGQIRVLVNCMVLTEGFDDPTLRTVWVRPSGRGPTTQMAGRVLRKHGDQPKQIVQCRDTRHPFQKTATPLQSYLWQSGEWRSLLVNPKLALCNQNVQRSIANTVVSLPKFLTRKVSRRPMRMPRR